MLTWPDTPRYARRRVAADNVDGVPPSSGGGGDRRRRRKPTTRHTRGATMCCSCTGTIWAAISGCTVTPTCRARGWTSWPPRASCSPERTPPHRCARRRGDRCSPAATRRATVWSGSPTTVGSTARASVRCLRSSPNPAGIPLFSACNTRRHTRRGWASTNSTCPTPTASTSSNRRSNGCVTMTPANRSC